jgi:8-oxo-dGTP diphosphatase
MQCLYPVQPVVGVGAVIIHNESILLVRRGKEPAQGLWSIPGGAVELGEVLSEAVEREVREECGLKIQAGPVVAVLDSLTRDAKGQVAYHYVLVDFWAEVKGGKLRPSSDAKEASWVPLAKLPREKLTQGLIPLLEHLGCLNGTPPTKPPHSILYWSQAGQIPSTR